MTPPRRIVRWRVGTALALAIGGAALVLGFLLRSPGALMFAAPLLIAPLAAYRLRPADRTIGRVVSSINPSGDSLELRIDAYLDPPAAGVVRAEFALHAPLRLVDPRPYLWGGATTYPTTISRRISSDWPTVARIAPPSLEWSDSFGLASVDVSVDGNPVRFERPPAGARQLSSMMVQRLSRNIGGQRAPLPSPQGDFQSVRPFAPGDGVRQINW